MVVVTATYRLILEPWCRQNAMEIIGSEMETGRDNCLTGRFVGKNCMENEKVARISNRFERALTGTYLPMATRRTACPCSIWRCPGTALPQTLPLNGLRQRCRLQGGEADTRRPPG